MIKAKNLQKESLENLNIIIKFSDELQTIFDKIT